MEPKIGEKRSAHQDVIRTMVANGYGYMAQSGRSTIRSSQEARPHHGGTGRLIRRQIVIVAQGVLNINQRVSPCWHLHRPRIIPHCQLFSVRSPVTRLIAIMRTFEHSGCFWISANTSAYREQGLCHRVVTLKSSRFCVRGGWSHDLGEAGLATSRLAEVKLRSASRLERLLLALLATAIISRSVLHSFAAARHELKQLSP